MSGFLSDIENPLMSKLCKLLLTLNFAALASIPLVISVLSDPAVRALTHHLRYAIFMTSGLTIEMLILAIVGLCLRLFFEAGSESLRMRILELEKTPGAKSLEELRSLWEMEWPYEWRTAVHQATGITSSAVGLALFSVLVAATLLAL